MFEPPFLFDLTIQLDKIGLKLAVVIRGHLR
jgi:hypothetical protein